MTEIFIKENLQRVVMKNSFDLDNTIKISKIILTENWSCVFSVRITHKKFVLRGQFFKSISLESTIEICLDLKFAQ